MSFTKEEQEEFKIEALELLEIAESSLLALDQGINNFKKTYDSVFRCFHNLKGASGMMEELKLQSHTHELENKLMPFKDLDGMDKKYINFFLAGIDGARSLIEHIPINFIYDVEHYSSERIEKCLKNEEENLISESPDKDKVSISKSAMDEFFFECDEIIDRLGSQLRLIETEGVYKENIENVYRDMHSLKGAIFVFGFKNLGDVAHAMESSMEEIREGTHQPSKELIQILFKAVECVELGIQRMKLNQSLESLNPEISEICLKLSDVSKKLEKVNNNVNQNELLQMKSTGVIVSHDSKFEGLNKEPGNESDVSNELVSNSNLDRENKSKENEAQGSIRVSVAVLDNLMTLMGEMVLVRNQVLQFSSHSEDLEFLMLSKRLNSVTSEIQGEMIKTRMQPIGNVLNKFHRAVRDLSKDLQKEITLVLYGAETELDKSLLESIKDPLTHLVRNSCDHGIETPDVRKNSGKPSAGKISIKSYHEGGQVVIEIADDGKGLNKEMLIKKAIEKNIITQFDSTKMNEKEIFNLIFTPGFSTAASITNVSGRGVGMDVVRTNIERIGGTIELYSQVRVGTTIKLKIPLTLAIVPALIVKSGKSVFAVPQVKLEQLVRVDSGSSENKIEYLHGAPVFRLRGNILPLVDLNKILMLETQDIVQSTELVQNYDNSNVNNIAILSADGFSFGLIVDEVQDAADIVVKPLNKLLKSLHVYSGATILGDGSIALILDVLGIKKVSGIGTESTRSHEVINDTPLDRNLRINQEFLLISLNSSTKHAIVLNYVFRLEEFKVSNIEISGTQRVVRYRDSILPLISINEHLGYGTSERNSSIEKIHVVVIQKSGILYGLEVDEIIDTLSTDLNVDTSLKSLDGIFGNLNTTDEIIVVIDPFDIINCKFNIQESTKIHSVKSHNILLVEDTVFFQKAIQEVLEKAGNHVTVAFDGEDALEKVNSNPSKYDLIISDIEMPRMNGFEFAKRLRSNPKVGSIPLIALSTRADQKYREKGMEAGFNVYLEKMKPSVILGEIDKLTQAQRRVS